VRKRQRRFVAGLNLADGIVNRIAVDPGRCAGLEASQFKSQLPQGIR